MSFPSTHPINIQQEKMVDPFSGNMNAGISLPTLKEFLDITKLSQYAGKFKKLKCVETEDLPKAAPRIGMKHVEEQRLRRYLDHYYQRRLTAVIAMEQPVSLEEFFRMSSLQSALKPVRALGVVEYDDLFWMAYTDISKIIPKKVEYARFKRYLEKFKTFDPKEIEEPQMVDLKSFLQEASLKKYKSDFEKLGVFEGEDFIAITRSDLPKMPQVEFDRFLRHRMKKYGHLVQKSADQATSDMSKLVLEVPDAPERRTSVPNAPPRSMKPNMMTKSLSLDSTGSLPSPIHSPINEQPPAYTPTAEYPPTGTLAPLHEPFYPNELAPGSFPQQPGYNPSYPGISPTQQNLPYGLNPAPNAPMMPYPPQAGGMPSPPPTLSQQPHGMYTQNHPQQYPTNQSNINITMHHR